MKVNLELEIGVETAVVISALESQADLFRDPLCTNPMTNLYAAVNERLKNKVLEMTDEVFRSIGVVGK